MKKKITIKIKPEDIKVRNEMHFNIQRATRAHIFKPRKGRGSFRRNKRVEEE